MPLSRRDFLLGSLSFSALGVAGGEALLSQLKTTSARSRSGKANISVGEFAWSVPVKEDGEPFLDWLREFFHLEFKEGPWKDQAEGRLLVYIDDKNGNTLVGEDLEVVINRNLVPNVGLEYLIAKAGDNYEIDRSVNLAKRYPFFQLHS